MYIPSHFEEPRIDTMHALIADRPLATLVTLSSEGLNANHIPLRISSSPEPYGALRGHVAKANPLWNDLKADTEALAIFHGPDSYISPSWYPTKQEHGKVVPTWNYAVVHAYGTLRIIEDPVWLRAQLEALTARQEAAFNHPWSVSDAPQEFVDRMIGAVVGIEIVITRLQGKWKTSQNQPPQNRSGVAAGLEASGDQNAQDMAALVNQASRRN